MADQQRTPVVVRMPGRLAEQLRTRADRRARELGTPNWSRNDEIVQILEAAVREDRRG